MRVLVVIPAFNEEQALGPLLAEAREVIGKLADDVALLVVDDGSRDGTLRVARAAGVRHLRLCRNLGIGGAVQSGLRVACRDGYDCAIQMDGDGQHPPSELPKLIEAMHAKDAPDLLIGSRFLGERSFRSSLLRRIGIGWIRAVVRVVARVSITDPTSGFRAYGPRALALFDETYPYDFPEPESIAVVRAAGLSARELPVQMRRRQGGQSSINGFSAVYYMIKVTLAVLLAYVRTRPRELGQETEDV